MITPKEMVKVMETGYGKAGKMWVVDRGMVSEKNLKVHAGVRGKISGRYSEVAAQKASGPSHHYGYWGRKVSPFVSSSPKAMFMFCTA